MSETIAASPAILSFAELIHILLQKIGSLYQIDCIGLILYDDQISKVNAAYVSEIEPQTGNIISHYFDQPGELAHIGKEVAGFQFPVIKSRQEWIDEFGGNHCVTNDNDTYVHHCYIPLEFDNKILGTLGIHNLKKELSSEGLVFCSNIADILAEAVKQIKAKPLLQPVKKSENDSHQKGSEISALRSELDKANATIKSQLNELSAYKEKLDAAQIYQQEEPETTGNYAELIGNSREMKTVFGLLSQVADSETTVLILGETGTGKELIARALHNNSSRKHNPMISINCAAIPPNLIESELFGHEKGSFTGATERRTGKFELANESTIFLDEIGELPLELQVKLLRVLQEKEFERVGGKTTLRTDVRVISATNRNLQEEVAAGTFRNDLFYRLNVFPVKLPSLLERKEDIPVLAEHFLKRYNLKAGKKITGFSNKAMQKLQAYHWPGNVRELEHLIERHVLLTKGQLITEIKLPAAEKVMLTAEKGKVAIKTLFENERDYIFSVLQHCSGRISGPDGAARLLGVPATTLNSKIKKLGLSKAHHTNS